MPRRLVPAVLLVVSLAVVGCGSEPGGRAATPESTLAMLGAACAPDLRDEFVRQQSLVYWPVYCPTELPDGFRLATSDDPTNATLLGGDASPTNGVGTFYTRLVGPDGVQLVLLQGLGASIYKRRDNSVYLGGFEIPLRAAPFGDLKGSLFAQEPPADVAFDTLGIGHMVSAAGLDADAVEEIAASMRPVDASGLRVALFSLADLHDAGGDWMVSWPPDSTGEDVRNPAVCQQQADPGARLAEVMAKFEAAPSGTAPDAGGHGPFLQQAVVRFGDESAARAYVAAVAALLDSCPKTWAGVDSRAGVTYSLMPEASPGLGDQSLAFRRSVYVDRGLVFANAAGAPCDPTRVSHVFARTARRAGHAGVRLHDLRHFHATQLLATNTHIRVVQERLGHATISVTLGTYSHLIPGLDATAAEAAAAALRAARARRGASA